MPKYLMEWKYTPQGFQALKKEGGSARRETTKKAIEGLGGKIESYYFAFGDQSGYLIADLPDNETAAAHALTANVSGSVITKVVVLLPPEEIDAVVKRHVDYRAPGT